MMAEGFECRERAVTLVEDFREKRALRNGTRLNLSS